MSNIVVKNVQPFKYKKPLKIKDPVWATDSQAQTWRVGGYSKGKIPAGIYKYRAPWGVEPFLQRLSMSVDGLVKLPDDSSSTVLSHIKDFWTKRKDYAKLNFVYKRGILLYGPPGSGKSATIYRLAGMLEKEDAVMILANSADSAEDSIEIIKTLEPERKIVVVFEDIDGIIARHGDEDMTHLLDGSSDVDGVLFLATTNYPERLPARLLNRPSRFDVVMKIGMPSADARRAYVSAIVDNLLIDIEEIVVNTDGFSIAEVKEVLILVVVFNYSVMDAVSKTKNNALE